MSQPKAASPVSLPATPALVPPALLRAAPIRPVPAQAPRKSKDVVIPPWQRILVGASAGMLGHSICFPIDMVKTRLQASQGHLTIRSAVRTIIAQGGARGFYTGLVPSAIGVGPEKALKLFANDMARRHIAPDGDITMPQQILAGCAAGVVQAFVATPNEYVKARRQMMDLEAAQGLARKTTVQIIREGGPRLWRGVGATLCRDIPYNAIFFPVFNVMTSQLGDGPAGLLTAGGTAGAVAAFLCTPADTIKTRLQIRGGSQYKGIVDCATQLLRTEGPRSLFKGALNRSMVQMPMYAIIMAAFVMQKRYLQQRQEELSVSDDG